MRYLRFFYSCFFPICSLINKLKPGIIKKVNRRSTPIAGLVSDVIASVFCFSTSISWSPGGTEVHDGSNHLLSGMAFEALQARDGFQSRLVFQRAAECFYSPDLVANTASCFLFGAWGNFVFYGFTQV